MCWFESPAEADGCWLSCGPGADGAGSRSPMEPVRHRWSSGTRGQFPTTTRRYPPFRRSGEPSTRPNGRAKRRQREAVGGPTGGRASGSDADRRPAPSVGHVWVWSSVRLRSPNATDACKPAPVRPAADRCTAGRTPVVRTLRKGQRAVPRRPRLIPDEWSSELRRKSPEISYSTDDRVALGQGPVRPRPPTTSPAAAAIVASTYDGHGEGMLRAARAAAVVPAGDHEDGPRHRQTQRRPHAPRSC